MVTLEEIKTLPPKERIAALKLFEEEQKKRKEESRKHQEEAEKKQKQETEELLKKSIDEVAYAEEEEEQLKEKEKEEIDEKKKKESLEDIAQEGKSNSKIQKDDVNAYLAQKAYVAELAQKPLAVLYGAAKDLQQNLQQQGYLTQAEQLRAQQLGDAMYQKQRSGYVPDENLRALMSRTDELLDEMQNPLRKRYH